MAAIEYTPPPTVKEFIKHFLPGQLFYAFIIGPVGSGKTTGLLFKIAYLAQLQNPSPVDGVRRTRFVIVRNTFPQLKDTTIPSFFTWFKDGVAGAWKASENKFMLKFGDCEVDVLFRALDTADDVARVLSLEVSYAVLDEFVELNKEVIEALSARCGRYPSKKDGGCTNWGMFGSSNPGLEDSHWYEMLFNRAPDNLKLFVQPSGFSPDAENLENLPGGRKYYTEVMKGKPDSWVKQFIEGAWGFSHAGKPVFPYFNREIHIAKHPLKPNPALPIIAGYDPGLAGSAVTIAQYDLHGRVLFLDEIVMKDVGTERMVSEYLRPLLKTKYQNYEFSIVPDPAAFNRAQSTEVSVADILKRAKFKVHEHTDNSLVPRLESMEHYLMRLTDAGPAVILDPSCVKLARALQGGYRYSINQKGDKQHETPEKNEHSHVVDAAMEVTKHFKQGADRAGRRAESKFRLPKFNNTYV